MKEAPKVNTYGNVKLPNYAKYFVHPSLSPILYNNLRHEIKKWKGEKLEHQYDEHGKHTDCEKCFLRKFYGYVDDEDYKTLIDKYDKFMDMQIKNPNQAWIDSFSDKIKRAPTDKPVQDYAMIFSEWEQSK